MEFNIQGLIVRGKLSPVSLTSWELCFYLLTPSPRCFASSSSQLVSTWCYMWAGLALQFEVTFKEQPTSPRSSELKRCGRRITGLNTGNAKKFSLSPDTLAPTPISSPDLLLGSSGARWLTLSSADLARFPGSPCTVSVMQKAQARGHSAEFLCLNSVSLSLNPSLQL